MKTQPTDSAYPVHGGYMPGGDYDDPRNHTLMGGLTKREYFAAQAMKGLLVNAGRNGLRLHDDEQSSVAQEALRQADALIEELNK